MLTNQTGWGNATYSKFQRYTQYHGIELGEIVGMLLLDVLLYACLAWYLNQVVPSQVGVRKPFYFIFHPLYRRPAKIAVDEAEVDMPRGDAFEPYFEEALPSVTVRGLRKTFGGFVALDDLSFELFEGHVFSLLGHNGAGKSTAINVLTGLLPSDSRRADGGAVVYGRRIRDEMDAVRRVTGLCPQHDVLFDLLTSREHLELFACLKTSGLSAFEDEAKSEVSHLLAQFHLAARADHLAHELSGGMRRKLSTAVALCGRSKFVLLDEPTAGMDALARRELWDLLAEAKKGRTLLLTTHYMDEADVLGDRVAIMTKGKLKCRGTSLFLKNHFGAGYRVVCETSGDDDKLKAFDAYLCEKMAGRRIQDEASRRSESSSAPVGSFLKSTSGHHLAEIGETVVATLPRSKAAVYGSFFDHLDSRGFNDFGIVHYGLTVTSLEDVFLAVGADDQVAPADPASGLRIGGGRQYESTFTSQVFGLAVKRLRVASRDVKTLALVLLPVAGVGTGFALSVNEVISQKDVINDIITAAIAAGGFLIYPALVAEQVVAERESKLRNVLTVMGCSARAYWVGSFLGDFLLFTTVCLAYYVAVIASGLPRWVETGAVFIYLPAYGCYLIAYSYAVSHAFDSAKRCVAAVPGLQVCQLLAPNIIALLAYLVIHAYDSDFDLERAQAGNLWLSACLSPQGLFWLGFFNMANELPIPKASQPSLAACFTIIAVEGFLFFLAAYFLDVRKMMPLQRVWPSARVGANAGGDDDVKAEVDAVLAMPSSQKALQTDVTDEEAPLTLADFGNQGEQKYALVVQRLRKVYPPKLAGPHTVAVHDCSFRVQTGQVFGLLGANGAGKSTVCNMVIRATAPTAGDARVGGKSVLDDFGDASKSLGVVAQDNTLWDNLTCTDHLLLFARLRGVPGDAARGLVEAALDQLELRPHAKKLASTLSGAVAVVGDPVCCLLDEPSAGLDPVSRRNLWNVLRNTMEARCVVLTSHLMEEVEVLCDRVAIMVRGKLRCLGTIQRLKSRLGAHYELEVAGVAPSDHFKVDSLCESLFGTAPAVQRAGGALRYEVPSEQMKVGKAFAAFEANKRALGISDYSISQPSLESVFIKTVNAFSGEGGADDERAPLVALATMSGCTRRFHRGMAYCAAFGVVACAGVTIKFSAASTGLLLCLVASIWGCVGCCCVLRPPPGDD